VRFEVWVSIVFWEVQGLSAHCSLWKWRSKCSILFVKYECSMLYLRFEVWGQRSKVCEGLWRFVKHYECECVRLEVWDVNCLSCLSVVFEVFLFFQSFGVHDVVVDGYYWWLLYLLKHSSNWSIYSFGGDSNNLVCNNTFISTIDKVSIQVPLLNFMCVLDFLLYIFYYTLHVSTNLFQLNCEFPCLALFFIFFCTLLVF